MSDLPTCLRCGVTSATTLVFRLHGEKGGPLVCPKCVERIERDYSTRKRAMDLAAFDEWGMGPPGIAARARPGELTRELIDNALQLTHPDRHAPEQQALATMVTAALAALRPYVRSVPKSEPVATDTRQYQPTAAGKPLITFPCRDCFTLDPLYYCDECRQRWEAVQRQKLDAENAKRRERRARKRRHQRQTCVVCREPFYGKRRDAKTCSSRCRVRLHRITVASD
jgi:hypothetical protein